MRWLQIWLATVALMISPIIAVGSPHDMHRIHHRHGIRSPSVSTENHTLEARDTSRLVFAHFMVGIVSNRTTTADWDNDMIRAKTFGIDAFALNIGTDTFTDQQLTLAYASAQNNGMKVFLSFDFNFWSTGSPTIIGQKIAQYGSLPAQLIVDGKVFASTFVGDGLDVGAVRAAAGIPIYFAPNFHPSYGTDMSPVDAGLNWMAWPNNGYNRAPNPGQIGTVEAGDSQYISALNGKDYIAPVSPWFFTHYGAEVSYSKNWMFPGELLWYQRWTELLTLGPRFVEIIAWNDYGESSYVGPLSSIHLDDGHSKWVNDMPHNGWMDMAKPFIAAYKARATTVNNYITSDQLIYWYRPQPMNTNCDATDSCMSPANNYAGQYYIGPPNGWQTVSDSVFVVSLLQSSASLQVTSGSNTQNFNAPAGASSFTVSMGVGQQTFALMRGSQTVMSATSLKDIINGCVCGIYNFNAYVGTVPEGFSDPLGPDGLRAFTAGLRVSTCSATPSLGTATSTSTSSTTASSTTVAITTTSPVTSIIVSTSTTSTGTPSTTSSTTTSSLSSTSSSVSTTTTSSTTASTTSSTTSSTNSSTTSSTTTSTSSSTTASTTTSNTSTSASSSTTKSSTLSTTSSTTQSKTTSTSTSTSTSTKSTTTSSSISASSKSSTQSSSTQSTSTTLTTSTKTSTTSSSTTKPSTSPTTTSSSTTSTTTSPSTTLATSTTTSASSTATVCVSGTGSSNYAGLCSFCCHYGYCPSGPCTCTAYGAQVQEPPAQGVNGQPAYGLDSSYSGLCSYACNHGYCPSGACRIA